MWRQERGALPASPSHIPHHLPLSPHLQINPRRLPSQPTAISTTREQFRGLSLFRQREGCVLYQLSIPGGAAAGRQQSPAQRGGGLRYPPRSARARASGGAEPVGTGPRPPLPRRGGRGAALPDKGRAAGASSGTCPRSSSGGGWEPARSVTPGERGSHRRPVTRWDGWSRGRDGERSRGSREGSHQPLASPCCRREHLWACTPGSLSHRFEKVQSSRCEVTE